MKKPFKIGDRVTTNFNSGEKDVIRTITLCEPDDNCGSGYRASADGGDPCECCGMTKGIEINHVDSAWFHIIEIYIN